MAKELSDICLEKIPEKRDIERLNNRFVQKIAEIDRLKAGLDMNIRNLKALAVRTFEEARRGDKVNCENCGKEIYFKGNNLTWYHFNGERHCGIEGYGHNSFATPKIDEVKKDVCKHCNKKIRTANRGLGWEHTNGILYCEVDSFVKAEPKDDLIILGEVKTVPTDCIKCNEIRYMGGPSYADTGRCNLCNEHNYLFRFVFGVRPKFHVPPTWCPLKAKEPEKTYPIELKTKRFKKMLKVFGKYDIYETEDGLNITGYSPRPDMMVDISRDIIRVNGIKIVTGKEKDQRIINRESNRKDLKLTEFGIRIWEKIMDIPIGMYPKSLSDYIHKESKIYGWCMDCHSSWVADWIRGKLDK